MIYNAMLTKQIDSIKMKQMVELGNQIEQKFSVFRAEVDGKKLSVLNNKETGQNEDY